MQDLKASAVLRRLLEGLARQAQAHARLKALHHLGGEVQKAQFELAGAVGDLDDELQKAPAHRPASENRGLNLHPLARIGLGNRGDARFVLVAQRQMQHKVPVVDKAHARNALGHGHLGLFFCAAVTLRL